MHARRLVIVVLFAAGCQPCEQGQSSTNPSGPELRNEGTAMTGHPAPQLLLKPFVASVSPDAKTVLVGYGFSDLTSASGFQLQRPIIQWDLATGQQLQILGGHDGDIVFLEFLPDGRKAVSLGTEGSIRVWDIASRKAVTSIMAYQKSAFRAALSSDGKNLVTFGHDDDSWYGRLRVWDLGGGMSNRSFDDLKNPVYSIALTSDGKTALLQSNPYQGDGGVIGNRARLIVWDLLQGKALWVVSEGAEIQGKACLSPDGKLALSEGRRAQSTDRANLVAWEPATGKITQHFEKRSGGHPSVPGDAEWLTFTPDGKRALTVDADGLFRCWKVATGTLAWSETAYRLLPYALSKDGTFVIQASGGLTIYDPTLGYRFHEVELKLRVWETDTGKLVRVVGSAS